jgi:hypothetical protein
LTEVVAEKGGQNLFLNYMAAAKEGLSQKMDFVA